MNQFADLGLFAPLQRALAEEGYTTPTPIQRESIPPLLAGRDMLGCAQTGTGKTAAFALPLLQRLSAARPARTPKSTRVLVMVPTRELALQVAERFEAYGRHTSHTCTVVFGGVSQNAQVRALSAGVDVLVATPGRLLDLMSQRLVRLDLVEALVLDEADRMLDMGFVRDVRKVLAAVPSKRQTLLFSATMPPEVSDLAHGILRNPVRVEVTPVASTVDTIGQFVLFVRKDDKRGLLADLLRDSAMVRTIVFTRTKHGANRLAQQLERTSLRAGVIHGNKSQNARVRALEEFRTGASRVLIATDIAARGIDIDDITHVVNYDIPEDPETYVHRIGRTARAGRKGIALSFCDTDERTSLRDIERLTGKRIQVLERTGSPRPMEDERPAAAPGGRPAGGHQHRPAAPAAHGRAGGPAHARNGGGERGRDGAGHHRSDGGRPSNVPGRPSRGPAPYRVG